MEKLKHLSGLPPFPLARVEDTVQERVCRALLCQNRGQCPSQDERNFVCPCVAGSDSRRIAKGSQRNIKEGAHLITVPAGLMEPWLEKLTKCLKLEHMRMHLCNGQSGKVKGQRLESPRE